MRRPRPGAPRPWFRAVIPATRTRSYWPSKSAGHEGAGRPRPSICPTRASDSFCRRRPIRKTHRAGGAASRLLDVDPPSAGMALALPVDGEPAPVGGPQAPPASPSLGPPRSPSEAAERTAQQRAARDYANRTASDGCGEGFAHATRRWTTEAARGGKGSRAEARRTQAHRGQARPRLSRSAGPKLQTIELIHGSSTENEAPYRPDTGPQAGKWAGRLDGLWPDRFLTPTGAAVVRAARCLRLSLTAVLAPGEGAHARGGNARGTEALLPLPQDP